MTKTISFLLIFNYDTTNACDIFYANLLILKPKPINGKGTKSSSTIRIYLFYRDARRNESGGSGSDVFPFARNN